MLSLICNYPRSNYTEFCANLQGALLCFDNFASVCFPSSLSWLVCLLFSQLLSLVIHSFGKQLLFAYLCVVCLFAWPGRRLKRLPGIGEE